MTPDRDADLFDDDPDAVEAYRAVADSQRNEVEQWRELSLSTGFSL